MRADYFEPPILQKVKKYFPDINTVWKTNTTKNANIIALYIAKIKTARTKIVYLVDKDNPMKETHDEFSISAGNPAFLCNAIANSNTRIAAIVVKHNFASSNYYKKVRELASAEGALLIWFDLNEESHLSISCQPDIICTGDNRNHFIFGKDHFLNFQNKFLLPNHREIFHANSYETEFVYNEIFVDKVYLKHGIKISDNATVFDVGANIGLFSLYVKQHCPTSKIYAFEPSPLIFQSLKSNLLGFGDSVKVYQNGLSDIEGEMQLSYYPGYSVISGFYTDKERDTHIILEGLRSNHKVIDAETISLVKRRMAQQMTFLCDMTTLSKVIKKNNIHSIELLKIDVEGAELKVMDGIKNTDWNKIKQLVMEIHNKEDVHTFSTLLKNHFSKIIIEDDTKLKKSGIFNIFAMKE